MLCGHIHLLPLAYLAARQFGVPLTLVVHGVEAWQPTRHRIANQLVRRIDSFVAVSEFTKRRLMQWTGLRDEQGFVVPNCVDVSQFGVGAKRPDLLRRYGLEGKTVILTLGRLAGAERYKGFDEVIQVLPELAREIPSICYVIAGDGPDRARLEAKAAKLGVGERVVFTGYIDEREKADHYRLADAFVMPERGEGFGIVYLEALACGIPVIASMADASREAVRDGLLGQVVDPDCPEAIKNAILRALCGGRHAPDGLDHFSTDRFRERWYR
ncbi:MAG: glycosyltransferase family 4 protein, partial [Gemmatimonadaceae bacterium]